MTGACGTVASELRETQMCLNRSWSVLAEAEPVSVSFFGDLSHSVGGYGIIALLAGLAVLVGACLVVKLSRRPAVIAAYASFVLIPLLIGIYGWAEIQQDAYYFVTIGEKIKIDQFAISQSHAWRALQLGLLASLPAFLVVAIGLLVRSIQAGRRPEKADSAITPNTLN